MFDAYKASGTRSRCDSETLPAPPLPPPSRPRGASPRGFEPEREPCGGGHLRGAEVLCAELGEERAHAAAARARADQRGDAGDARGAQALQVRERLKNTNKR